jgi:predicted transcriptional regulator
MCTGGLCTIGAIYDFFTLPRQVKEANIRRAVIDQMFVQDQLKRTSPNGSWRYVNDGDIRSVKEKETVERTILKLAKANKGILTPTEVALEANISMDEAKKSLDELVSKGFAELRVRQSGTLVYAISELMDTDSPLETF